MKRTKANIRVQLTYEAFRMNQESHFANKINQIAMLSKSVMSLVQSLAQ